MSTQVPTRSAMTLAVEAAVGASDALRVKELKAEDILEISYIIGPRLSEAFGLACQLFKARPRTGKSIPYLTHLMAVAYLVGESGGSEDEMIAALLHDAPAAGPQVLSEIRARFGDGVAEMITFCSDAANGVDLDWVQRKRSFLSRLAEAPIAALRVACADKLHNAQTISRDLKSFGPTVFDRHRGNREGTLWYYRSLARLFGALLQDEATLDAGFRAMIRELRETVAGLEG